MPDFNQTGTVSISCPKLISDYLKTELEYLGFKPQKVRPTGVDINASLNDCVLLNLSLRTAHRIHYLIGEKHIPNPDALYSWLNQMPWEDWIDANGYVSVTSRIDHPSINNTQFANLRVKDAIVDRLRDKAGGRPDSGPDLNKSVVFLFWNKKQARIFMDTSGESLSRRGYRMENTPAPMQETLAAAILHAAQWNTDEHLINPMCGSGTIAIEAALAAVNAEPAPTRRNFGFMHIKGFDREVYKKVRLDNRKQKKSAPAGKIIATDSSSNAVKAAQKNAAAAGVGDMIEFKVCDFTQTQIPDGPGAVIMNPPYGERIGDVEKLKNMYTQIGDFLKQSCTGKKGYVITGNPDLGKLIGLRPNRKIPFYNSTIECKLFEYELYEGSKKDR